MSPRDPDFEIRKRQIEAQLEDYADAIDAYAAFMVGLRERETERALAMSDQE